MTFADGVLRLLVMTWVLVAAAAGVASGFTWLLTYLTMRDRRVTKPALSDPWLEVVLDERVFEPGVAKVGAR